jgi:hypothetical protein
MLRAGIAAAGAAGILFALPTTSDAAPLTYTGLRPKALHVVVGGDGVSTVAKSYVNLPGAQATVVIPAREEGLVLARFSGETRCTDTTPEADGPGHCSIGIVAMPVGGGSVLSLEPSGGAGFAFAGNGNGFHYASVERARVLPSGTYRIQVQWKTDQPGTRFGLDDWTLVVQEATVRVITEPLQPGSPNERPRS